MGFSTLMLAINYGLGLEFASSILSVPGDATIPVRCSSMQAYLGNLLKVAHPSAHGEFIPRAPPSPQKLKTPKPGNQPTHK